MSKVPPIIQWRNGLLSSDLSSTQRLVALVLSHHMNASTGSCFPSVETVAAEAGLAYDSTRRALRSLERAGWLEREIDHRGEGRGTRVVFTATTPTTGTEGPATPPGAPTSTGSVNPGTPNPGTPNPGTDSRDHRDSASVTTGIDDPGQEVAHEVAHEVALSHVDGNRESIDHSKRRERDRRIEAALVVLAEHDVAVAPNVRSTRALREHALKTRRRDDLAELERLALADAALTPQELALAVLELDAATTPTAPASSARSGPCDLCGIDPLDPGHHAAHERAHYERLLAPKEFERIYG